MSPHVLTSRALVNSCSETFPMPLTFRIGRVRTKSVTSASSRNRNWPLGLFWSEQTLAISVLGAMPALNKTDYAYLNIAKMINKIGSQPTWLSGRSLPHRFLLAFGLLRRPAQRDYRGSFP